jgi:uncharacterized protein (TIGR00725 family)
MARRGCVLLCGGRGGIMERAAAGAKDGGGRTVGVLPGRSARESPPNESIELPLFTGLGQARNLVLVLSSQAIIAIDGGWGTLSEIAHAIKHGVPVVLLESWEALHAEAENEALIDLATESGQAVDLAMTAARRRDR